MHSKSALLAIFITAGCGDNLGGSPANPDAGPVPPGEPDGGVAAACPADLDPAGLDRATWDSRFTIPGLAGRDGLAPVVYDFARDVDGSVVATGTFSWHGADRVEPLVRLRDGEWVPARTRWELPPPPAGFSALDIDPGGDLALATYDDFGERDGEIWLDDGSGLRVIGEFLGLVRTVRWFRGQLWVAGWFAMQDGAIAGVAVWDGGAWSAAPGGGPDGYGFELTLDGDEFLVGGGFTTIGGIEASNVAAYDGTDWRDIDLPGEGFMVFSLQRGPDGALYAGGGLGGWDVGRGGIARLDGDTWSTVGGGLSFYQTPGVVTDLATAGDSLFVTGCFGAAGGASGDPEVVPALQVARWDGESWHSLDEGTRPVNAPWFQPGACGDEGPSAIWDVSHQRLIPDGDGVLLGGNFPGVDGVQSQSLIGHADGAWQAQGPSGLGVGGWIDRLVAGGPDCTVYALGSISHAAGEPVSTSLLGFDGQSWHALGDRMPVGTWCPAFAVSDSGEIAAGCLGPPADDGGPDDPLVLRMVDGEWTTLPLAGLGFIQAMAFDGDGRLLLAGGGETGYLARLVGDRLEMIEDGFDGAVSEIDVGSSDVLLGGSFTRIGDVEAARIARWNGSTFEPLGAGVATPVLAIGRDDTAIYASTADDGSPGRLLVGAFDGESWTELATPRTGLTPQPYFQINAIRAVGGRVIVAGSIQLDEGGARGALVWDGERFSVLAGGVGAIYLDDIAVAHGALWFGGGIAEVGAAVQPVSSVGVARLALP